VRGGPRPGAAQHPMGPLFFRLATARPGRARIIATLFALGCIALLALAAWMVPDPSGVGTHRQLGLPPCSSVMLFGRPCPTCGMTTAFAHTVRGHFLQAVHAQPAGFLLAIATAVGAGLAFSVALTGRMWYVNWYRLSPVKLTVGVIVIVIGSWAYKLVFGS